MRAPVGFMLLVVLIAILMTILMLEGPSVESRGIEPLACGLQSHRSPN